MKATLVFSLLAISVSLIAQSGGTILWKFKANDSYIQGRPAIAADGTIYALGINGHLYALTPQGTLKWTYTVLQGSAQSVSVGKNGTIYFAGLNTIYAINPNGTLKWKVTNTQGGLFDVGPTVGPDGNIYAVADNATDSGLSAISIQPSGKIRWNKQGYIHANGTAGQTKEIIFGDGKLYFCMNNIDSSSGLQALNMSNGIRVWAMPGSFQPAISGNGRIYTISARLTNSYAEISAYDVNGKLLKKYFGNNTIDLTPPDADSNGVFYTGRNYQFLTAENTNGTEKFAVKLNAYIGSPVINSTNTLVAVGGSQSGAPGYVAAVNTSGQLKWKVLLSLGAGKYATPVSRPKFSNNNTVVYVGTSLNYTTSFCYLYAISTGDTAVAKTTANQDVSGSVITEKNPALKLYPNPVKNNLVATFSSPDDNNYSLKISDLRGYIFLQKTGNAVKGNNVLQVNVSQLPQGKYVISLQNGETTSAIMLKE